MSSKIKQKLILSTVDTINADDIQLDSEHIYAQANMTPASGLTVSGANELIKKLTVTLSAISVTVTDTGGANGGYGSQKLVDLPDSHIHLLGAAANLSFSEAAAGISNTAGLKYAVGTAAEAADDTLDSTSADVIASTTATLTSSAASNVKGTSTAAQTIDASGGSAALYLNLGIPNADISASGAVVVSGTVDLYYLDIGNS